MPAFDTLDLTELAGTADLQGRAVLLMLASDLDDSGRSAELWLVVTERAVSIVVPGKPDDLIPPRCIRSYLLNSIEACRVQTEVGSRYLQIRQNNIWIDLLRFSNRLSSRFREAARRIERLCRHREFPLNEPGDWCPINPVESSGLLDDPQQPSKPSINTVWRVAKLVRPEWKSLAVIGGLSVFAVAIELAPPWLQKILVDRVLGAHPDTGGVGPLLTTLAIIVGGLAVVRLTAAIVAVIKARMSSEIGTRLTADLRTRMVEKLEQLPVAFHDRNQVGLLMSRVVYDTESMHTLLHHLSGGFLLQILQLGAIGVMMFALSPKLAMYTLLPMPLVLAASWFFFKYLYTRNHRYWDAVGRQASALTSLLSGIRVVKSFTQESREHARFAGASERLRASRLSVDLGNATFSSIVGVLFGMGGLIVWYLGGRDVLEHQMTLGSLMAFLAYLTMFYAPLTTVCEGASWISSFLSASHRIFELLDMPVEVDEPAQPRQIDRLEGHICFEDVGFAYDGQKPVLSNLSFEIAPGEAVGIVGRSGSGKSTLVSLVSRLYDVDVGSVTIDGIDVRDMSCMALRRRVGVVLQEPCLFQGTLQENISYGDPGASPERILASASAASAHEFILRMPFGYDTMLGERGAGLSGGERQRISIARAILYEPQILILDEATSSVDAESERLIQRALERFSHGRTTLVIAHRLSTLEHADRLFVMESGQLIEQGTHQELIAADGAYARLLRLQFGDTSLEHARDFEAADEQIDADLAETDFEIRWLEPHSAELGRSIHNALTLTLGDRVYEGVYTVRAFPATYSEEYLSLRYVDEGGRDRELGMLRRLEEWPADALELVRRSLNRRYLLRVVQSVVSSRGEDGLIHCSAETEDGAVEFTVHNDPHRVTRFGRNGWLLTDVDGNHFVIPDLDGLPFLQRRLLKLHFADL